MKIEAMQKELNQKQAIKNTNFSEIAKTISQATQGALIRSYNKTNAEAEFEKLTEKTLMKEDELKQLTIAVSQPIMRELSPISLEDSNIKIKESISQANKLLKTTVSSVVIGRLKDNSDISYWVEQGLTLHHEHKNEACEFCGNKIAQSRLEELAAYFNYEDTKLKQEIDQLLDVLRSIYCDIKSKEPIDKMNLYEEYRSFYEQKKLSFNSEKLLILSQLETVEKRITEKKAHTTEAMSEVSMISTRKFFDLIDSLNEIIIEKHNKKTELYDRSKKEDCHKIEVHYLSTIYDEVVLLNNKIEALKIALKPDERKESIEDIKYRIAQNKAKISTSASACESLNKRLVKFLGHSEISFDFDIDETGYRIFRDKVPAINLSEGEKTAVAFVYFVTQLEDNDFDVSKGIIVIDDPISSLDSNSQFQAFSFMKNATQEATQLFILTHNFDFLKLSINWVKNKGKKKNLFMIKNYFSEETGNRECAYFDKLDTALVEYESEYHYLFNLVKSYTDDSTIENAYTMPNIARKLLDTYLMYKVPINSNTYKRLQELKFDEDKKVAIYKFCNDQSHITGSGFDPSLVPETKKCIGYLLELMEMTDKQHYEYLVSEAQ